MEHPVHLRPSIAVLVPDTLAAIGLSDIITRMMPGADVCTFADFETLAAADTDRFFHFFISSRVMLSHAAFFLARRHKTIVLVQGDESSLLPQGLHVLNVCRSEDELVRDFLRLAGHAHGAPGADPVPVREARGASVPSLLTPRECEVLRLIVGGMLNKEIAARLGVGLATVVSHRKNITEKLGTRSVGALTIYAVTHGIVSVEEI